MATYTTEKVYGGNFDNIGDSYYVVISSDYPIGLASFDTKKQAEAFIEGILFAETLNGA